MAAWSIALVALAAGLAPRALLAQAVSEVQIAPPQLQVKVGAKATVSATLFSAQGDILSGRRIRWSSANLDVARIEYDTLHSDVATVVGVGVGFVLIEARVGNVTGPATVQVEAAIDALPPPIIPPIIVPPVTNPPVNNPPAAAAPALPDTSFAPGAAEAVVRSGVRIDSYRFGTPATCGNGAVVGDGLILTSYNVIVGADSVVVTMSNGIRVSNARVASYDAVGDVSVLKIPAATSDSLLPGSDAASGQAVWLVGATDCTSPRAQRTRVANRDVGSVQLDETGRGWDGAAVVGQRGELLGLTHTGGRSGLASSLTEDLRRARAAVTTASLLGVDQVARRENQSYGTVVLRSDLTAAAARMTPLEKWQPSTAAQMGSLPFAFSAPMGRYRAELLVSGLLRATDTVSVIPGQSNQVVLAPPPVLTPVQPVTPAPQPQQPPPGSQIPASSVQSGGGFPWGIVLLLGAGGGAAALLLGKKSGTTTSGSTGSITIHVPNN